MLRIVLNAKIDNAIITRKRLDYSNGSIGIDEHILKRANVYPNERVQVLNYNNGMRFETYVIAEKSKSGIIALYGPATRMGEIGDKLCILSYKIIDEGKIPQFQPIIIKLQDNKIQERRK